MLSQRLLNIRIIFMLSCALAAVLTVANELVKLLVVIFGWHNIFYVNEYSAFFVRFLEAIFSVSLLFSMLLIARQRGWLGDKLKNLIIFKMMSIRPESGHSAFSSAKEEMALSAEERRLVIRARLIAEVDRRVKQIRQRSIAMLVSIAFLLIVAATTVVFAGSFVSLDTTGGDDQARLQTLLSDQENRIGRLSEHLASLDAPAPTDRVPANDPRFRFGRSNDFPNNRELVQQMLSNAEARRNQLSELIIKSWQRSLEAERGLNDTKFLIASAVTRLGVVLLILFLVQILVGLYRYNTRLAAFYLGRRDALQIWTGDKEELEGLQKLFTPSFDLGKEPKHPIEDIVNQLIEKIPTLRQSARGAAGNQGPSSSS